jgi:paraquat-inducible protein B
MSTDDSNEQLEAPPESFPDAEVRPKSAVFQQIAKVGRDYWWAIGGAILVVLYLWISMIGHRGSRLTIDFAEGHRIKSGDSVRHLGIEIGIVEVVQLKKDGAGIRLEVRVAEEGEHLAREGTRFWIARPEVSLSRIQGLDTVIGANYVAVLPGPHDAKQKKVFQGNETPIWLDDAGEAELVVEFQDGQGLRVGDPLRYRGIEIGEVMNIVLSDDLKTVRVHIQLNHTGSAVARTGSQFWIQHPDVSISGITGLDTIVGGRYVAVIPGPTDAAEHHRFVGLDAAPAAFDRPSDGLEIRLTSSHRSALRQGVPIAYRGMSIGRILSTGLAADAVSVEARVYIRPEFKHLVRQGSVFWNAGGVRFKAGVGGVDFHVDSLESVVQGSVAMATPEAFGDAVTTGDSFSFQFSVFSRESPLSFSDDMSLNGNGSFSDRGDVKKKAPTSRSTKSLEICVIV